MRIGEVMTRDATVISPRASVREAARIMDQLNVGALPVCDGRRLVGIVTDRDITVRCTAVGGPPDDTRVHEIMTDDVRWCFDDASVEDVEREMSEVQIRRMPVIDRKKNLVGIVALGDLATDRVPGTEDTLRRISEPSEPDRSGTVSAARGAQNAGGPPRARAHHGDTRRHRYAAGRNRFGGYRGGERGFGGEPWSPYGDLGQARGEPGSERTGYRGYTSADRDETGLGPSGMDPGERYQRGGYGGEDWARPRDVHRGFAYGSGGYGAEDYGRGYADELDRGSRRGSHAMFDRAQEVGPRGETGSYRGRGPRGYRRSDERIREDVNEAFLADPELDATNIDVAVADREVRLSGTVGSRYDRRRAEDLVESISGVMHVRNDLRIHQDFTTGNPSGTAVYGREGRKPPSAA